MLCEDCRFGSRQWLLWFGVVGSVESGKGENDFKGFMVWREILSKWKPPLGGNKSRRNLTLSVRKVLAGSVTGMSELPPRIIFNQGIRFSRRSPFNTCNHRPILPITGLDVRLGHSACSEKENWRISTRDAWVFSGGHD